MKNERRHELEKNILADRLAGGIQSTRSYLPIIFGGLAILAVVALGWAWYSSRATKNAALAWTDFYFNLTGGDADAFADVADSYPGSTAAAWSMQVAGDSYLQRGIETLYRNKSEGRDLIEQAIAAYESVEDMTQDPDLSVKALLGLAEAHESLGQVDEAAGYYQQVVKKAEQPSIINEANERLAFLNSSSGKEFYSWFDKLDPKPDAPIELPGDLSLPPTMPDLQFGPTTGLDLGSPLNGLGLSADEGPSSSPTDATPGQTSDAGIEPGSLPPLPSGDVGVPEIPPAAQPDLPELELSAPDQPEVDATTSPDSASTEPSK